MRNCTTSLLSKGLCRDFFFFLVSSLLLNEYQATSECVSSEVIRRLQRHKVRAVLEVERQSRDLVISIKLHKYTNYLRVGTEFLSCFHMDLNTKGTQFTYGTSFSSLRYNIFLSVHHKLNNCMTLILIQSLLMWWNMPVQVLPENNFFNFLF